MPSEVRQGRGLTRLPMPRTRTPRLNALAVMHRLNQTRTNVANRLWIRLGLLAFPATAPRS
jgi:hypothetical protein